MEKLSKQDLRKEILEGMCKIAEEGDLFSMRNNKTIFKPEVADKMIFSKILDDLIDNIHQEYISHKSPLNNKCVIAQRIMDNYYWPVYGFDKQIGGSETC